jgi:ABC-type nitrate/sulfonate/bicarbonate transport system substrate-binding protein
MKRRTFTSCAVAACAALAIPVKARAATKLAVTVFSGSVLDTPMVVGLTKGIFAKYGLEVQPVPVATGFEALAKVADGVAQVGSSSPTALAQLIAAGRTLKGIVASNGDATGSVPTDSYIAIVARGPSGLHAGRIADLRGKRIAVRLRSDFHQYLLAALSANGLDSARDVTIVDSTDLLGALRSGSVDAVVSQEPNASRIVAATGAFVLQRGGNHMQFLELRVVAPDYLAANGETINRFVTSFSEAAQYVRTHLDESTDIMVREHLQGMSRENVRTALGFLNADVRISKSTVRAVQDGIAFAAAIGTLKRAPRFDEMFDLGTLREVERRHPDLFSDLRPIPDALAV